MCISAHGRRYRALTCPGELVHEAQESDWILKSSTQCHDKAQTSSLSYVVCLARGEHRRNEMTVSESYGTPDETSLTDNPDVRTAHARPSQHTQRPRGGLRRVLGLLAGLIVLAMLSVLAYNLATSYFALNGAWYGPLRIQVGSGRVSLEAYMDISTYL